jgi:hypothetical protein
MRGCDIYGLVFERGGEDRGSESKAGEPSSRDRQCFEVTVGDGTKHLVEVFSPKQREATAITCLRAEHANPLNGQSQIYGLNCIDF